MACPSRNPDRPLTDNQRLQLMALYTAGAMDRESGVSVDRLPQRPATANPLVIGALRDKGLAESRSRKANGRSWTEYWLTDKGRLLGRDIIGGRGAVRAIRLEDGDLTVTAVLAGAHGASVLLRTPGTQTLWTADQAEAAAARIVQAAAEARQAAADAGRAA